MPDGSRNLQAALFNALNGNLTDDQSPANNVPVYDNVPQDAAPMYVRIGEDSHANDDTKVEDGVNHDIEIHVYSSHRGLQQVKYVMSQVYDLLHRVRLTAAGFEVHPGRFTFQTEFLEPDGARGVMRYNLSTFPE